jgi:cell shape-determining protein MreC
MPVLAAPGTLLGKVTRVERTRSEVTTIFNASWRSSVRFEGTAARALLTGGEKPSLTLIPRGKEPVLHAKVVNVDPSFPYGLFLGTAGEIVEEEESPWRAAPLELTYQEFALAEVLIVVNFE